jgi:hypothetical protein
VRSRTREIRIDCMISTLSLVDAWRFGRARQAATTPWYRPRNG